MQLSAGDVNVNAIVMADASKELWGIADVRRDSWGHLVDPLNRYSYHISKCATFPWLYRGRVSLWQQDLLEIRRRTRIVNEGDPYFGFVVRGTFSTSDCILPLAFPIADLDQALALSAKWHSRRGESMHGLGPLSSVSTFACKWIDLPLTADGARFSDPELEAAIRDGMSRGIFPTYMPGYVHCL